MSDKDNAGNLVAAIMLDGMRQQQQAFERQQDLAKHQESLRQQDQANQQQQQKLKAIADDLEDDNFYLQQNYNALHQESQNLATELRNVKNNLLEVSKQLVKMGAFNDSDCQLIYGYLEQSNLQYAWYHISKIRIYDHMASDKYRNDFDKNWSWYKNLLGDSVNELRSDVNKSVRANTLALFKIFDGDEAVLNHPLIKSAVEQTEPKFLDSQYRKLLSKQYESEIAQEEKAKLDAENKRLDAERQVKEISDRDARWKAEEASIFNEFALIKGKQNLPVGLLDKYRERSHIYRWMPVLEWLHNAHLELEATMYDPVNVGGAIFGRSKAYKLSGVKALFKNSSEAALNNILREIPQPAGMHGDGPYSITLIVKSFNFINDKDGSLNDKMKNVLFSHLNGGRLRLEMYPSTEFGKIWRTEYNLNPLDRAKQPNNLYPHERVENIVFNSDLAIDKVVFEVSFNWDSLHHLDRGRSQQTNLGFLTFIPDTPIKFKVIEDKNRYGYFRNEKDIFGKIINK